MKYFTVTQTSTVMALSKRDAMALVRGKRGVQGKVLGETGVTERISASEAHGTSETV